MAAALVTLFVLTFAVALSTTAADPDLLQDLCVADLSSSKLLSPLTSFVLHIFINFIYCTI